MSVDPFAVQTQTPPPAWALFFIKLFNRARYRQIRDEQHRARILRRIARYGEEHFQFTPAITGRPATFKHSGNAGDLIYALPCIQALAAKHPAHLRLALNVPLRNQDLSHPLGAVMLNEGMFKRLQPLLAAQPYIGEVGVHDGSPVDFDLDVFRDSLIPLEKTNISRWYFHFHGVSADLSQPWLSVPPDTRFADTVLLARSGRYRNTHIDYRFLSKLPNLAFIGVESEYQDMRLRLPNLRWHQADDFLQLASAVAGCRFFIGNQSFPFSLAEGIKVPRLLEADPLGPNVVPAGLDGHEFFYQKQFEALVEQLLSRTAR